MGEGIYAAKDRIQSGRVRVPRNVVGFFSATSVRDC